MWHNFQQVILLHPPQHLRACMATFLSQNLAVLVHPVQTLITESKLQIL